MVNRFYISHLTVAFTLSPFSLLQASKQKQQPLYIWMGSYSAVTFTHAGVVRRRLLLCDEKTFEDRPCVWFGTLRYMDRRKTIHETLNMTSSNRTIDRRKIKQQRHHTSQAR